MERKSAAERLIRSAHVRLDEAEDRAFQQVVEGLRTTRSRLLKKIIREMIGLGPDMLTQEWKLFEALAYQLAAVGRNFNQLIRAVHSGKATITPEDLVLVEKVRDQIDRVEREVIAIIDRSHHRWVKSALQ